MLFRNAGGQKFLPGTESIECVEELNECLYIPPTHHPLLNVLNLNITYLHTYTQFSIQTNKSIAACVLAYLICPHKKQYIANTRRNIF